jgi:ubiquitin C-terminal hydrolase
MEKDKIEIIDDAVIDQNTIETTPTTSNHKSNLRSLFDEIEIDNKKKNKKKGDLHNKNNTKENVANKNGSNIKSTKTTKPKFLDMNLEIPGLGIETFSKNKLSVFKGLSNYGNNCYSNVVMQCLISLKEFVSMLNQAFKYVEEDNDAEKQFPIFYNLVKIMNYYNSNHITY